MSEARDAAEVAARIAARLEEDGIDYAIGGALALAAHGVPRMTNDADLSVFLDGDAAGETSDEALGRLFDALERAGCLYRRERALADTRRLSLFQVKCGGVGVDLFVAFHSVHHAARARRVSLPGPGGEPLWFLSAEDLAVLKLALFRAKDRADLERLFATRGGALDLAYVRGWIERLAGDPRDPRCAALDDLARRFAS